MLAEVKESELVPMLAHAAHAKFCGSSMLGCLNRTDDPVTTLRMEREENMHRIDLTGVETSLISKFHPFESKGTYQSKFDDY